MSRKSQQPKTRRKSRRPRLPFAIGDSVDHTFAPTHQEWLEIEDAYGHAIPSELRDTINSHVMKYFRLAPAETEAPFVDDAIEYLDRLAKAADDFFKLLHDSEVGAQTNEAGYVRSRLDVHLRRLNYPTCFELVNITGVAAVALTNVREEIEGHVGHGFTEGSSWSGLVYDLDMLFTQNNLPQKISKSDDPAKASPFVRFFQRLQSLFPSDFRRHGSTLTALTEAMVVARREIQRVVKARRED
jgi:hypothetical protein